MDDLQIAAFRWIQYQPLTVSLAALGLALLMNLQGFRFARLLTTIISASGAYAIGAGAAQLLAMPSILVAAPLALVVGGLAASSLRIGVMAGSAFVGGLMLNVLVMRFTNDTVYFVGSFALGFIFGACLWWVCRRVLPILMTASLGAGLLVLAFVGLTNELAPSLSDTFVSWSNSIPLLTPGMMTMLFTLGYSVQASAQQGDVRTGAGRAQFAELMK